MARLLRVAEQGEVLDDEAIQRLVTAAALSRSEKQFERINQVVASKSIQNLRYPFKESGDQGSIRLGSAFNGSLYGLPKSNLLQHLLAVGQSGSGKTTLFYNLFNQVEQPCWFFDLKQDYRHLTQADKEVLALPWRQLRFNPLRPPNGVSPRRWAQVFSEIFGHATALLSGSKNHLMKKIIQLYRAYGLFDQVSSPYPSLHELEQLVRQEGINYVRKQSDYRDTLLNRLEAMNLVAGTVFDCSRGYRPEELLERNVVFEFDGLSRDTQNFLMEILFAYVYEHRIAQNHRDQGLNHLFFLDEGKRVFSVYKERQDAAGIPEVDELTAKMREFGEGLVVADQEASKLTDSIKANTYTKVLMQTGSRKQFSAIADSMNLSKRQREFAQDLSTGEAIIQTGNHDPVPVKLDDYSLDKQVSDEELRRCQAEKWAELSVEERGQPPEFQLEIGGNTDGDELEIPDDPGRAIEVSNEADRLLEDVVEEPFKSLTERYQDFSSSYKGNQAKDELVEQGVVVERYVRTQQGKRKLLELTEKGREYAENSLDLDVKRWGRGGVVHRYWQHRIQELFEEAGWDAYLEKFDADVYVHMDFMELVVEVAMGNNPREIQHVQQHLEKGFTVWITCPNSEIRDGIQQRLQENDVDTGQVVFRLFRQFNDPENLPL